MTGTRPRALIQLARMWGVQASYADTHGKHHDASADTLVALLRALGAPLTGAGEAADAVRETRDRRSRQWLPPVSTAWDAPHVSVAVAAPAGRAGTQVSGVLTREDGTTTETPMRLTLPQDAARGNGTALIPMRLALPNDLDWGYHRLRLSLDGQHHETLVIRAPRTAHAPARGTWCPFLPLYAVRSERTRGVGDTTALAALVRWARAHGAEMFGTLPLLAAFLDGPVFEPSPYMPVSRLAWNELFIDPTASPELSACAGARDLLASSAFARRTAAARAGDLVDYREAYALKRQVLELLASACTDEARLAEMGRFYDERPWLAEYARFRAATEHRGLPWRLWTDPALQAGTEMAGAERYHRYVQWLAEQQIANAAGSGGLYLDLPVGVHPDGFDPWRWPGDLVDGVTAGAPPDDFFTQGQDWGFQPLHPQGLRASGYGSYIEVLRHHLRHASALRIDHVMGLHRMYCIPAGASPRDGAYVRYPSEELYAVLCLESRRHETALFGEDLGTVPGEVRKGLRSHGIGGMHVAQFLFRAKGAVLPRAPRDSIASLNTHDMAPFARFWRGADIDDRAGMGLLTARTAATERRQRAATVRHLARSVGNEEPARVAAGVLTQLAAGSAATVLVNLEDLWGEDEPQNVPATGPEQPNWRRRAALSLEELRSDPRVATALAAVDAARKAGRR